MAQQPQQQHQKSAAEKRRILHDLRRHEEEVVGSLCRLSNRPISPRSQMEQEKRIRREIANSNERRRMQSINAGFQSLRTLLPHHDGEKLSKAAILQQTAEYIYQLEQEKTRLLTQNCQLKRLLNQQNHDSDGGSSSDSPLPKRKKIETVDVVDEGIGSMSPPENSNLPEPGSEDLKREMIELRVQLDRERRLRMALEEQTRNLETQLYPERIREITQQVQLHYQQPDEITSGPAVVVAPAFPIKEEIEVMTTEKSPSENQISIITESNDDDNDNVQEESPPSSPKPTEKPEPKQQCRPYTASTSRQNLETIVEAIRHLEGDHLFGDETTTTTTKATAVIRETKLEDNSSYNHIAHTNDTHVVITSQNISPYRQHVIQMPFVRPGVIVSTHS